MTTDRLVGQDLAHYHVETILGRGGMGVVYRAVDTRLGRTVALKVLSGERAGDPEFRDRFVRESRLLASIDHPNIVPIFEAGDAGDVLYIAMRFIPGPELRQIIADEAPMDAARAIGIIGQVADALDAAHRAGLVHRDVKPGNVLVLPGATPLAPGYAYLTDFGLTKATASDTGLTKLGQFVGTPGYIAPEQIEGLRVDHRADIYALGCILYNCLSGNVPYPRESTVAALFAHLQATPPKLSDRRPDLPKALDAVIAKALAKSPDQRYQTCRALAVAAQEALVRPRRAKRPAAAAKAVPGAVAAPAAAGEATLITPAPTLAPALVPPAPPPAPAETAVSETPPSTDGLTDVATGLALAAPAIVDEPEAAEAAAPAIAEPASTVFETVAPATEPEAVAMPTVVEETATPTVVETVAPATVVEAAAPLTVVEPPSAAGSAVPSTVLDDSPLAATQAPTVAAPPPGPTTPEHAQPAARTDETILPPGPARDARPAAGAREAKQAAVVAVPSTSERPAVARKTAITAPAVAVLVLMIVLVGIVVGVAWDVVVGGAVR